MSGKTTLGIELVLQELARQVGLNEEKLKKGFEQMFQTTPFQYLRDRRLEQAQQLLLDTEQSIKEVGESSPTKLTRCSWTGRINI